jgi:hypothetical protein
MYITVTTFRMNVGQVKKVGSVALGVEVVVRSVPLSSDRLRSTSPHLLPLRRLRSHIHSKNQNSNVSRNVGTASTNDAAKLGMPTLHPRSRYIHKATDKQCSFYMLILLSLCTQRDIRVRSIRLQIFHNLNFLVIYL